MKKVARTASTVLFAYIMIHAVVGLVLFAHDLLDQLITWINRRR